MYEPAYLKTIRAGEFSRRLRQSWSKLENCTLCPRRCGVNRLEGEVGFCRTGEHALISSAAPHFGEETPLVGKGGSGTIFFTSCNLKCVFCQNFEISHLMDGSEASPQQIGAVMLQLQFSGCVNINFVSPSHIVPQIISAVYWAAENGLSVPLVYNSGGYDSVETLRLLDGIIDIYMPDLKFMDPISSSKFMDAADYPKIVSAALKEMHRQVGDLEINEKGLAERGLLVRHLVMPNGLAGTELAMKFLVKEISPNTYVNIMDQYMPCGRAGDYSEINHRIGRADYDSAVMIAQQQGITRLDDRMSRKLRLF